MRSQVIVHSQEDFNHWLTENQVAQQNSPQILAVNPGDVSPTEFLAPYAQNMGINSEIIPSFKSITK